MQGGFRCCSVVLGGYVLGEFRCCSVGLGGRGARWVSLLQCSFGWSWCKVSFVVAVLVWVVVVQGGFRCFSVAS